MVILRWIIINMKDFLFADAITQTLTAGDDAAFQAIKLSAPADVLKYASIASVILMETTSVSPFTLAERLELRNRVKAVNPSCKIVLIVDENSDQETAKEIKRAKLDGKIDQFIYGSTSASYLRAILETI